MPRAAVTPRATRPIVRRGTALADLTFARRETGDEGQSAGDGILLNANNQWQYITLALGSALALFLYPH
ncbi:hypothetical protein, partial [Micromonospora sp. NPDC005113]